MAEDRWNEGRNREPFWADERRRERERERERQRMQDTSDYDYRSRDRDRRREEERDEHLYRPFGDTGPVWTRGGGYSGEGRSFGASGRYEDMSPGYRDFNADQRRMHRGDYEPARYTPNPREGRGDEPRSWWEKTQDEMASWFGDENARRRREWDERRADYEHDHEQGEHRGRGPKGYRRSDERIADDVNDRLTEDPYVDASDIEVRVKDGEVTLTGTIFRREDKRRAEDLAESVSGVTHVQNNLRQRRDDDRYGSPSTGDITL